MKLIHKISLATLPLFSVTTALVAPAPVKAEEAAKKPAAERFVLRSFKGDQFVGAFGNAKGSVTNDADKGSVVDVQFGGVNQQNWFGGTWFLLSGPKKEVAERVESFGLAIKGDGTVPQKMVLFLTENNGAKYISKNINEAWEDDEWHDLLIKPEDFPLESEWKKKNPEAAQKQSKTPNWDQVNRVDLTVVGPVLNQTNKGQISAPFLELKKAG